MNVSVVRTSVAKWRLAQALVPAATVLAIVSRHLEYVALALAAVAVLGATSVAFLSARRSYGRRQLRAGSRKIQLGEDGMELAVSDVIAWTIDGDTARIYGPGVSWKLVALGNDGDVLQSILAGAFGKAKSLKRRGTLRGRRIAFVVFMVGAGALGAGIAFDVVAVALVGVPCLVLGFATWGALSQKIAT